MADKLHLQNPEERSDEKDDAEDKFKNGYYGIGIAELEL